MWARRLAEFPGVIFMVSFCQRFLAKRKKNYISGNSFLKFEWTLAHATQIRRLAQMKHEVALILDNCLRQDVGKGKTLESKRGIWNQGVLYRCIYGTDMSGTRASAWNRDADAF